MYVIGRRWLGSLKLIRASDRKEIIPDDLQINSFELPFASSRFFQFEVLARFWSFRRMQSETFSLSSPKLIRRVYVNFAISSRVKSLCAGN